MNGSNQLTAVSKPPRDSINSLGRLFDQETRNYTVNRHMSNTRPRISFQAITRSSTLRPLKRLIRTHLRQLSRIITLSSRSREVANMSPRHHNHTKRRFRLLYGRLRSLIPHLPTRTIIPHTRIICISRHRTRIIQHSRTTRATKSLYSRHLT